jgi:hypothetical protein
MGAAFAPLLLVPVAWHNKVLSNTPVLWEMKENQTSRFAWEHVPDNARGMFEYWFLGGQDSSNSVFVSVVAMIGLLVALGLMARTWRILRNWEGHAAVGLAFGIGIAANLVLVCFYFWSRFTDPMASRFSLPAYVVGILCAVTVARWLDARWRHATPVLLGLTLVSFLGFSVPKQSHHIYSQMGIQELEWERRTVAAMPPASRLVLTNKTTLVWLLDKTPSLLLGRALLMQDRIAYQLTQPTFQEVLVMQGLRPVSAEGYHQIVPEDRLPDNFELESLAERRFGTKIARISRLVAIHPRAETPNVIHE